MNFNKILVEAITKTATRATRKPITNLRRDVAMLKRDVAELKRIVRRLGRQTKPAAKPEAEKPEAPSLRPTSKAVLKLRRKLGLTQAQLAKLAGVSTLTVSKWETSQGRLRMRGHALAGFARVRGMGKREALNAMAEKGPCDAGSRRSRRTG